MLFLKQPGTVAFIWDGPETGLFPKTTQYFYRAMGRERAARPRSPAGAAPSPVAGCPMASHLPLPWDPYETPQRPLRYWGSSVAQLVPHVVWVSITAETGQRAGLLCEQRFSSPPLSDSTGYSSKKTGFKLEVNVETWCLKPSNDLNIKL